MKTPEELNALKEKTETQSEKLHLLNEDELVQVSGGTENPDPEKKKNKEKSMDESKSKETT